MWGFFNSDARVKRLHELLAERITAAEIAKALGSGCTKNIVIAHCRRNRIAIETDHPNARKRAKPAEAVESSKPKKEMVPRTKKTRAIAMSPAEARIVREEAGALEWERSKAVFSCDAPRDAVDITALGRTSCRWAYGADPPFKYCGRNAAGSYCAEHAAIAYVPTPKKINISPGKPVDCVNLLNFESAGTL